MGNADGKLHESLGIVAISEKRLDERSVQEINPETALSLCVYLVVSPTAKPRANLIRGLEYSLI